MNSKRTTIIFLSVLLLIALGLTFVITRSFLEPFAFAIILAVVFYPMHERILQRNHRRPGSSALLSTLLLVLLFGVPSFIIAVLAANEALVAAHYLGRRSVEEGGFASLVMSLAKGPLSYVGRWVDLSKYDLNAMISANTQKVSVWLVGFGANVLSGIARFIIDALITFVVVFFLFRDGAQWAYRAGALLPLSREQVVRLYRNISDTIIANVYGILSVGVAQDPNGRANGLAVTSARQPLVDDLTVRQTGAIAFALSGLVNDRISAQQVKVFGDVKNTPKADLDKLARLDVAQSD